MGHRRRGQREKEGEEIVPSKLARSSSEPSLEEIRSFCAIIIYSVLLCHLTFVILGWIAVVGRCFFFQKPPFPSSFIFHALVCSCPLYRIINVATGDKERLLPLYVATSITTCNRSVTRTDPRLYSISSDYLRELCHFVERNKTHAADVSRVNHVTP